MYDEVHKLRFQNGPKMSMRPPHMRRCYKCGDELVGGGCPLCVYEARLKVDMEKRRREKEANEWKNRYQNNWQKRDQDYGQKGDQNKSQKKNEVQQVKQQKKEKVPKVETAAGNANASPPSSNSSCALM